MNQGVFSYEYHQGNTRAILSEIFLTTVRNQSTLNPILGSCGPLHSMKPEHAGFLNFHSSMCYRSRDLGLSADDLAMLRRIQPLCGVCLFCRLLRSGTCRESEVQEEPAADAFGPASEEWLPRPRTQGRRVHESDENWFLDQRIYMVDPKLSGQMRADDHPKPEILKTALAPKT